VLAPDDLTDPAKPAERYFGRTADHRYGVLCHLPHSPLSYLATPRGGEFPPMSTLRVSVSIPGAGSDFWDEVISLVHSDNSEENGDHFAVETDELQRSALRFGNGVNGRLLPPGSTVTCEYQVGQGHEGNVGVGSLRNTESFGGLVQPPICACWNPFDITNGADPEPVASIIRNAPEAYRARQLRAVTAQDYAQRAEAEDGVARAAAGYRWTGSWRTVRVALDPKGTDELSPALALSAARHLQAVRLIGEDLEIRSPAYVPLYLLVGVCLQPEFWPADVRFVLEQEFSDGYTPDGRLGFFHPDNWTFGQRIRKSEVAGRVHQVTGVEHINYISWGRFNAPTPGMYSAVDGGPEELLIGTDEIVQVRNDPDHLEGGFIRFYLQGGRQ
jgi:predicted phage baseplate assembly protein